MPDNINIIKEELDSAKDKLLKIKHWATALLENSVPAEDPSKESVYYCAEIFLKGELEGI